MEKLFQYSNSVLKYHLFRVTRLFVPHDEAELQALSHRIAAVYGELPQFIRLGIKQLPRSSTREGWYWGSGEFNQIQCNDRNILHSF